MPHQKAQRWFDQHPNRLGRKNQEEATDLVSFSFNGHPVVGRKGESIAVSLIAAGIRNFRQDRGGKNRGIYCGMGTCFECLVQINGSPSQRACLIPVENGMDIQRMLLQLAHVTIKCVRVFTLLHHHPDAPRY